MGINLQRLSLFPSVFTVRNSFGVFVKASWSTIKRFLVFWLSIVNVRREQIHRFVDYIVEFDSNYSELLEIIISQLHSVTHIHARAQTHTPVPSVSAIKLRNNTSKYSVREKALCCTTTLIYMAGSKVQCQYEGVFFKISDISLGYKMNATNEL